MKTTTYCGLLILTLTVGVPENFAHEVQEFGTRLLLPSSARSGTFTSLLVVFNLGNQPNNVTITARRSDGSVIGQISPSAIPVGGRFRSTNILAALGGAVGDSGPITVESTNDTLLSAVSEVSSVQGTGGFFPGVNIATAWTQGFIMEVVDTGDRGSVGTHRTNIGVNNPGSGGTATVTITFHNDHDPAEQCDSNDAGSVGPHRTEWLPEVKLKCAHYCLGQQN
jgi:hypothetical protein